MPEAPGHPPRCRFRKTALHLTASPSCASSIVLVTMFNRPDHPAAIPDHRRTPETRFREGDLIDKGKT